MSGPLLAELDLGNTIQLVGIICLPLLLLMFKWQAKRDQRLIDKGKNLAEQDARNKQTAEQAEQTKEQTRTLIKWTKRQFAKVNNNVATALAKADQVAKEAAKIVLAEHIDRAKKSDDKTASAIEGLHREFMEHDDKDTRRFDEITKKLDTVIKNGHDK